MAIFNFLHQSAVYTLMARNVFAKLFFVLFFSLEISARIQANIEKHPPSIETKNINSERYLCLNYNSTSALCVFFFQNKWYLVWDCGKEKPHITLPNTKDLPPSMLSLEYADNVKDSNNCIILKFDIYTDMVPVVKRTTNGWSIYALPEYASREAAGSNQLIFDQQKQGIFRILSAKQVVPITLEFNDGCELYVLPTLQTDGGLDERQSDYVYLLETIQGACMIKLSDQLIMESQGNDLIFSSAITAPMDSELSIKALIDDKPNETFLRKGSLEPSLMRDELREKSTSHSDDIKKYSILKLKQAWLEIVIGEGLNALHTLELLESTNSAINKHYHFLLLKGFALCLAGKYEESAKILKSLPNTVETKFWTTLALSQLNQKVLFDENLIDILRNYPPNLTNILITIIIPYLFETEQIDLFKKVVDTIAPKYGVAKAITNFYIAKQMFNREDQTLGYKKLAKIAKAGNKHDLPVEFQTEAAFITYMFKNSTKPPAEIIKELEVLQTQSRGSAIEITIALEIIAQYEKIKNYIQVINILQDLAKRFEHKEERYGFSHKLDNYVLKFFKANNPEISQVKYVSLFHKYYNNLAKNPEFETIALSAANKLEQLNLIQKAANLVLSLYKSTTDTNKKYEYLLKACDLYLQNNNPDEVIALLHGNYPDADPKFKPDIAALLSKAYFKKKDYNTAINFLEEFPSKANKRAIADLYIQTSDYEKIASSLKDYLITLKDREDDKDREKAILQLSAAYRILSKFSDLKKLKSDVGEFMNETKSAKIFAAFCRPPAEEIQTLQEVHQYIIDDGNTIHDIIMHAQKVLSAESATEKPANAG